MHITRRAIHTPKPGAVLHAVCALAVALFMAPYLVRTSHWTILDSADFAIHEAGHLAFSIFGELPGVAGGTLLQLALPAAFVIHFVRAGNRYATCMMLFWVAQNLFNIAAYVEDARRQSLPLFGAEYVLHDWGYLLARAGLLRLDETLATLTRGLGAVCCVAALVGSLRAALAPPTPAVPKPSTTQPLIIR